MEHNWQTNRLERNEELCALVQDLLPLYLDDEVSSNSRAPIVAHLNECAHCAGFLAGARSVREQLRREREQATAKPVPVKQQIGNLAALVIAALGIAAVVAVVAFTMVQLFEGSRTVIDILASGSPRALYPLIGLLILGATSWLMLRPVQHVKLLWLMSSFTALILGLMGFTVEWPNELIILLRWMLLLVGFASLLQWWHVLRDLAQRDIFQIAGLTLLLLGIIWFGAMFSTARLAQYSLGNAVPPNVESMMAPTVPPVLPEHYLPGDSSDALRYDANRVILEGIYPTPTPVPYQP